VQAYLAPSAVQNSGVADAAWSGAVLSMLVSRGDVRNVVATLSNPVQPANFVTMHAGASISFP
jgi:hypothetical protein